MPESLGMPLSRDAPTARSDRCKARVCPANLTQARASGSTGPGAHEDAGDLLATNDSRANSHGTHQVQLEPYAYRWFRAEGLDRNVPRP